MTRFSLTEYQRGYSVLTSHRYILVLTVGLDSKLYLRVLSETKTLVSAHPNDEGHMHLSLRGLMSYHRGVESRHDRVVDFAAVVILVVAGLDHGGNFVRIGRCLHIGQTFGPSCRTHQPHEGKYPRHSQVLKQHPNGGES